MLITLDGAHGFAHRWFAAWNAGDLDAIMACYDAGIEHSSPFIARFNGTAESSIRGIGAVREYFGRALATNPTPPCVTRFQVMHVAAGHGSVILVYRRWTGELACEVFFLTDAGAISRSISHYG
jgi:hypothetical protein